jgi:hypothetical protein
MTVEVDAEPARTLAWRIPTTEETLAGFTGRFRWFLTLVVASLVIAFVWPAETRLGAFVAAVPLLAGLWWWLVLRPRRQANQEPNVWLDEAGLRWQDGLGKMQSLPHSGIRAFVVWQAGPTGAVRLVLEGGFQSQPLRAHPPISAEALQQYFTSVWRIPEEAGLSEEDAQRLARRVAIYSEMHDEDRVWHLEGTLAALAEFADHLDSAAAAPLPPPGACPLTQMVIAVRREEAPLSTLVDHATLLGADMLSAPPERLRDLAARVRQELANRSSENDQSFEWPTDDGIWTISLHTVNS